MVFINKKCVYAIFHLLSAAEKHVLLLLLLSIGRPGQFFLCFRQLRQLLNWFRLKSQKTPEILLTSEAIINLTRLLTLGLFSSKRI